MQKNNKKIKIKILLKKGGQTIEKETNSDHASKVADSCY